MAPSIFHDGWKRNSLNAEENKQRLSSGVVQIKEQNLLKNVQRDSPSVASVN